MRFVLLIFFLLLTTFLSSVSAQSTSNYPEADFDMVVHENRIISYPHSSNPALVVVGQSLILDLSDMRSTFKFALGNRSSDSIYFVENDGNAITIPDINPGMYDLLLLDNSVLIDVQTKSVRIYNEFPSPFSFIQVTDTHLPIFGSDIPTEEAVSRVFQAIEDENPDFVLLTGDFLEGAATYLVNTTTGLPPLYTYRYMIDLGLRFLDRWDLPIFVVPGNHDLMKIYPDGIFTEQIWYDYFYPNFIQQFSFNGVSFTGYGAPLTGINASQLIDIDQALQNSGSEFNILYTHSDYELDIVKNQEKMGVDLMIQGHLHVSRVRWRGSTLWVETHNAYEPEKYEPKKGYRVIEIGCLPVITIDGVAYDFDNIPVPVSTPNTQPTTKNAIPIKFSPIMFVSMVYVGRKIRLPRRFVT